MHRLVIAVALLVAGCSDDPPPTEEQLAQEACVAAVQERLGLEEDEQATQTLTIGVRPYGWLVRGLSADVAGGARNYHCRVEDGPASAPVLADVRLCAAGPSPWGCAGG